MPSQPSTQVKRRIWPYLVTLSAISLISRLPQLLSPNLLLDGDECTLGLMARHLAQGREFPIFFYGQHYGFSLVEAAAGALSFVVFGAGALPLKLSVLALWTTGVLFLFLAQSRLVGPGRSFWVTSVLLLHPAWAVWSMKARGGYVTAFTATAALLWLLTEDRERATLARWLVAGILTAIIYLAQPLWLPGVLPVLVVALLSRRRLLWGLSYLAVTAAAIFLVKLAPTAGAETWAGPPLGNPNLIGSLQSVAQQLYVNLTGAYYLWWALDPPGPATNILAIIWCGMLPAAVLVQLYRLSTRQYHLWSHLLFASVCSTLVAEWALLGARDPRYLLPLSGPLVLLAGIEFADLIDRQLLRSRTAVVLALAVLLLGSVSMGEFRAFSYLWKNPPGGLSEARRMQRIVSYLKAEGIRHVFSMNGLLQWQLMFYSDEDVLARSTVATDRYPAYVRAVDRALANGEPVAVVGYTDGSGAPGCQAIPVCTGAIQDIVPNPGQILTVDGKYFVYAGADEALLKKLGFRLPD